MTDKIEPYSPEYYKRLTHVAIDFLTIHPCKECGSPVIEPYICTFCRTTNS